MWRNREKSVYRISAADADTVINSDADGACANTADMAVLGTQDIMTIIGQNAMTCGFNPNPSGCMSQAIADSTGLSSGCSDCFGDVFSCAISTCFMSCLDINSPECQTCITNSCAPAFTVCSGVSW